MSDNSLLAIVFDVWISGTKLSLDKKSCITSIDIKETDLGADNATINLSDPNMDYIEDNIFIEDNKIKIQYGWSDSTYRNKFEGYISAIDISFDSDGIPKLTITCMDKTHKMNRKKKNKTFKNCTRADVVKKVVTSYGYKCVIDSSYKFTKEDSITQSDQTDADFLQKLAGEEVYPFTARLVGNTFYYVKRGKLGKSVKTMNYVDYPHEVISLSLKVNKESKKTEVKSSKVSAKNKKVSTSTNSGASSKSTTEGSAKSDTTKTKQNTRTYDPKARTWTKE